MPRRKANNWECIVTETTAQSVRGRGTMVQSRTVMVRKSPPRQRANNQIKSPARKAIAGPSRPAVKKTKKNEFFIDGRMQITPGYLVTPKRAKSPKRLKRCASPRRAKSPARKMPKAKVTKRARSPGTTQNRALAQIKRSTATAGAKRAMQQNFNIMNNIRF